MSDSILVSNFNSDHSFSRHILIEQEKSRYKISR